MEPRARALVGWIAVVGTIILALASAGAGAASSAPRLPGDVHDVRLSVAATGRAVAAWAQAVDEPGRYRLRAAERGPSGWAPPRTLTPPEESVSSVDLAGNDAGDVVVVWQRDPARGAPIRAASRTAAGEWSEPVDLATSGSLASGPRVAVGADGTAVAVWGMADGTLAARVRRPGEAWGPMRLVSGPPAPGLAWGAPAVAPDGSALIAWASGPGGERTAHAAHLAAGAEVIGAATPLSAPGDIPWPPEAALGPAGEALLAWRQLGPDRHTGAIMVAARPRGGPWSAAAALAAPEAVTTPPPGILGHALRRSPDAVIDAFGRAVVVWADPIGDVGAMLATVRAAVRAPAGDWDVRALAASGPARPPILAAGAGGTVLARWHDGSRLLGAAALPEAAFGAPEDLTPSAEAISGDAEIGMDGSGALVAVWRSTSGGRMVVRAAARPPGGDWGVAGEISGGAPAPRPGSGSQGAPPAAAPRPTGVGSRPPRRADGPDRVTLSVRQLRINQRIAQAALRRVRALEARIAGRPAPLRPRARPRAVRLTRSQLVVNQRISQSALRRVAALAARLEGRRPPPRRPRAEPARIALTAAQLLIDQRIAQAAVRRVAELEAAFA